MDTERKPDSARADSKLPPRDRLRTAIVEGLAESAGKTSAAMHWGARTFPKHVVCREGKLLAGWPPHIPFGDPNEIPAGDLEELLRGWEEGTLRWCDATAEDMLRARDDPHSVLPSTPLARRRRGPAPHEDVRWVVGTLTMHVNAPFVVRPAPPSEDAARPAKRRRVEVADAPFLGQRRDNNTAWKRRFRNRKNGVQTPQYVVDDASAESGCVALDKDLGRAVDEGRAVVRYPRKKRARMGD